ncbi:hypothetical protein [Roseateles amylovorans]|uniref:Uncharacterized protein n=1 Tax=Roseateles amylovorans TaxID=2978473 RepID=A0ABY6B4S6_9BURK|nr:hypothetical protein [Roseateles amylovorans]UXH79545.1 hypothetical protein N4261_06370 [Roseateles amylovorans]
MTSVSNMPLVASRQLTSRPSGSYEINAKEYGTVAATAIGLTQAAYQGGENAVSTVVHWSEDGLQALEDGAKAVGSAVSTGVKEVKDAVVDGASALAHGVGEVVDELGDIGSSVAGYVSAGVVAGKALIDEIV